MQTSADGVTKSSAELLISETLFDIADKQSRLDALTARMAGAGFWDNQERAQPIINQTKPLNNLLKPYKELATASEDLKALCELAEEDASLDEEVEPTLARMEKQVADFELKAML